VVVGDQLRGNVTSNFRWTLIYDFVSAARCGAVLVHLSYGALYD
jgi:hypothetical protein